MKMMGWISLLGFSLLLSAMLTFSHALLRSASDYAVMEFSWVVRISVALLLYGFVFIFYALLLKYFNLSILFPVYTAFSLIGVFLVGALYFGEEVSVFTIVGLILLIIGSILMSM